MKRLLAERGLIANSPKEVFRMAALEGFISDPELRFDFLKKRNLTVHIYNEKEVDNVLLVCQNSSKEINNLLKYLGISKDEY